MNILDALASKGPRMHLKIIFQKVPYFSALRKMVLLLKKTQKLIEVSKLFKKLIDACIWSKFHKTSKITSIEPTSVTQCSFEEQLSFRG